jgi:hypothetical protein
MRHLCYRIGLVGWVVGATAVPAHAFYWVGWPGANPVSPPAIVSQSERVPERPPSVVVDPPTNPEDPDDPPGPKGVPEPATLGIAAIGLSAFAVRWWKQRKKK